jgi:DNA repair protein RadC
MSYVREIQAVYKRTTTAIPYSGRSIASPEIVAGLARDIIGDAIREQFIVLYLNIKNHLISFATIGIGSVSSCSVSMANIFKGALLCNAVGLIACHNHPSDDPAPSWEDDAVTKRLIEAGKLIEVVVLDHIVVAESGYFSYAEVGRLEDI